jgi:hypothetical protein
VKNQNSNYREFLFENVDILIALGAIIFVAFFLVGRPLLPEGTALFGDFVPTLETRQFLRTSYPLWSNRNTFNYVGSMRLLYLLVFYSPFYFAGAPAEVFFKFMILSTLVVSGISMYIMTRHFLRKYNLNVKTAFLCCLISSIFYAFNPWVMDRVYHIFLLVTYAFIPLVFLFSVKVFSEDKVDFKRLLALVLLSSIASTSPHSVFFILLLIVSLYVFFLLTNRRQFVSSTKSLALFAILYLLVNAFWILPLANYTFSAGSLYPDYVVQLDDIRVFSRNSDLPNVLSLVAYWWPAVSHSFDFVPFNNLWIFASLIIPAFCFLALVFYRKNKMISYLSILAVVLVFLAEGIKSSVPGFYEWLCFDAPVIGSYGWLFRDPNKWTLLLPLALSVLFAFACFGSIRLTYKLRATVLRKVTSLTLVLLLFSSVFVYVTPSTTNYFNGPFKPVKVPPEIDAVNNWLANDPAFYNVLWLPSYAEYGATWVYSGLSGAFELDSSAKPTFDTTSKYSRAYLDYLSTVLLENRSDHIADYLDPLNIRYVIFHNDSTSSEYANGLFQGLQHDLDLDLAKHDGFVCVFENKGWSQSVFQPFSKVVAVVGGFDRLVSLNALGLNASVVFTDQSILDNYLDFDTFVLYGNLLNDEMPFLLNESLLVAPFDFTTRYSPTEEWSRASLSDLFGGAFHPYVQQFGIGCWDFDYDKGVAFTLAPHASLNAPFELGSSENYSLFLRVLESTAGGNVTLYVDNLPVKTIDTLSQANRFVWESAGDLSIKSGKHSLTLENVDGLNAVNLVAIVPYQKTLMVNQRLESSLQNRNLLYVLEGESDVIIENASVSKDYGGEASNGLVVQLDANSRVTRTIDLVCPGNYSFALRGRGSMVLKVDGVPYEINLQSFDWAFLNPVALSAGKHDIEVSGLSEDTSSFDVLWLLKLSGDPSSLDALNTVSMPARVLSMREIDPTEFTVELEVDRPFMLRFPSAYDPAWRAIFNGQSVKPVRLFGVANGFWIDSVGRVNVTVIFQPQLWFYGGLVISSTSLAFCIMVPIFLRWRKRENRRKP